MIEAVAGAPERAQAGGADGGVVGGPVDQAVVIGVGQDLLFEVRKQADEDAAADEVAVGREQAIRPAILAGHSVGIDAVTALVIRERQAELLEVVDALSPASGLACRLDGRQQERDQDRDDRDDDQELDQGEAGSVRSRRHDRGDEGGDGFGLTCRSNSGRWFMR